MKKIWLLISFIFLSSFIFAPQVSAEKINSFDVDILAHSDGAMTIKEKINYDFEQLERHGIFRYVPHYSKVGGLYRVIKISDVEIHRDGKKEKFETTKTKEQIYFKIGDPNKTISGNHEYEISYKVENGIGSNYETHDEIYWNVTGNEWLIPIEKASVEIKTDFNISNNKIACFTRSGDLNAQFCKTDLNNPNKIVTTNTMNAGEGLTVVYGYPKGTFPASTLLKELPRSVGEKFVGFIFKNIGFFYLILNILIPSMIFFWYRKMKNKKRFGKPSVVFEIPKDEKGNRIAPAVAGTIDSASLQRDDIVATLFDLAIRKYIKLVEVKVSKKLMPDKITQKVLKKKEVDENLSVFEKKLMHRLFKDGNEVNLEDLKKDFYKTYSEIETDVFKELVYKKYYIKNPKAQRGFLLIFGLIALFTFNILLGIILIYLSRKLIGRTSLGDEIDFKIDGIKLFLKSMDRNYKWQAEKFITIEQMIPYAISLGFIDKFMEQLKIIKPDYSPTWYSGYRAGFFISYASFYSSVNSNVSTSAPSSSSGFSGGSSGGGGGGGGGGSW